MTALPKAKFHNTWCFHELAPRRVQSFVAAATKGCPRTDPGSGP
jgi:hypothetical protein